MKIRIGSLELRFYASRLEKRTGICSQRADNTDSHMLLCDFDNAEINNLIYSLDSIQKKFDLPTIYIVKSSPTNYHAYCFCLRTFREIILILSSLPEIDESYLRLGVVRGYYTLRISDRKGEMFKAERTLISNFPDEMAFDEMTTNEYLTSNKGGHNAERK